MSIYFRILILTLALPCSVSILQAEDAKGTAPEKAEDQFKLAVKYATGDGVTVDKAEAVKWLKLAAKQGCEPNQKFLKDVGISW